MNQDACQNVVFSFTYAGTAAFQQVASGGAPAVTVALTRVAGDDRIRTAVAASKDSFGNGGAAAVVLTRSDLYPDALAGTPLAVARRAPMLLTAPTGLDPRTEAELQRVLPKGRTVYVLGGTSAVSSTTATQLSQDGYLVTRPGRG